MRALALLAGVLLLAPSCATERDVPAAAAGTIDSTFRAAGLPTGKIKFTGPVTIQLGGTNNTASAATVTKPKAPVAAAPHATATETTTKPGLPWYVYVVGPLVVIGLLAVAVFFRRL